ncbi:hypothetical protein BV22DRAFT_1196119 [Leucogyrophana mollusca]|uniref:Uncharacterized protein n=1 Tax=Leucogyrophana mollusca TaxID=85980 RepID=A0ACB8BFF2_9AGAM|nr:hypothetical protein BV22DRAFT_1196119 [Leucogyrophana mollusca]
MIATVLFTLVASAVLFLCCRVFLQRKLYSDLQSLTSQEALPPSASTPKPSTARSWHSYLGQSCFSLCFSESTILFAMLMCQGLDLLEDQARLLSWRIALFLLLATILLFIPASFSLILTHRPDTAGTSHSRTPLIRIILTILPVLLYIFVLSYIPLPAALTSYNPLTAATARLVVLGTTVLGLLSGFGALFAEESPARTIPSASSIASAENALERVKSDLQDRSQDLESYSPSNQAQSEGSWVLRMTPFKRDSQLSSLQQEVAGLQALESQMTMRLSALKRNRRAAEFADSFKGKALSRTWAVYCVARVCSSIINIASPPSSATSPSSYGDIMAHVLAYLVSLLPLVPEGETTGGNLHIDVPSLSRQISLALVGVIILSSVRVVLRGVTRAFRITSRNVSASLMLLVLAQLMGIYLLSTLVQLRTMFPPSPSTVSLHIEPPSSSNSTLTTPENTQLPATNATNLFLTLPEYSLFGGLFDWSFLLGACACAVSRWAGGLFGADGMDM